MKMFNKLLLNFCIIETSETMMRGGFTSFANLVSVWQIEQAKSIYKVQ